jgi:amino acid transporter
MAQVSNLEGSHLRPEGSRLRRELRFFETLALSLGIMAPTAVLALNGVLPAGEVGRAVPLAFVFAGVAVLLVSYCFVRLTRLFSSAGSVYTFTGRTLGPRAGFVAGWALLGTYLTFTIASTAEVGLFAESFLRGIGVGSLDWLVIAIVAGAIMWFMAYGDVRVATRSLLTLEGISVTFILVLFAVIYVKLFAGSAPRDQHVTLSPFSVPDGVSVSTVGLAAVAGFLSFGGFEGAAALGEESHEPRRTIPRAIITAVVGLTVLYVFGMFTETIGFGTDAKGIEAFAGSSAPLDDLSRSYVGSWMGVLISFGAMLSAFASALGTLSAGSRILFSFGRDGFLTRRLGHVAARTGSPSFAVAAIMLVSLMCLVALRAGGESAVNVFFYLGTIGVLSVLIAYITTTVGGIRFLFGGRRAPQYQVVVPLLAILALGYTLYKNLIPVPAAPYNLFPYIAGGWLVVGIACVVLRPGFARRIDARLAVVEEGDPAEATA